MFSIPSDPARARDEYAVLLSRRCQSLSVLGPISFVLKEQAAMSQDHRENHHQSVDNAICYCNHVIPPSMPFDGDNGTAVPNLRIALFGLMQKRLRQRFRWFSKPKSAHTNGFRPFPLRVFLLRVQLCAATLPAHPMPFATHARRLRAVPHRR